MSGLGEIGLTHQEFLARIPATARAAGAAGRYQADYALTRIVAKNCGAVGEHANKQPALVVKGGFAIRHLYAGVRYSKDADLAMATDELELEGPQLMVWPSDMRTQEFVNDGMTSWRLVVRYRSTDRRELTTQVDLNDRSRAIRKRPAVRRTLTSLFMDPFPVWSARLEEIVGEKLCALMDWPTTRIKDCFDIRHVLGLPMEKLVAADTREIYREIRKTKGKHVPDLEGIAAVMSATVKSRSALQQWQADVLDFVPDAPSLAMASTEMLDLLNDRVFKD